MSRPKHLRVGVVFGGRSGEHEVSLSSARNVMEALEQAGHTVIPIGITPQGRWLTQGNPMAQLAAPSPQTIGVHSDLAMVGTVDQDAWALLPHPSDGQNLPTIDVIFPVLHGPYGEDGTIQGLFDMANLPYVGCGVLASALAMDKAVSKRLFALAGLRQTDYRVVMRESWQQRGDAVLDELEATLPLPLFVKPANLGSSVGISKTDNRTELSAALQLASRYDRKMVVEVAVPNAREIEVSVLGNDTPLASVPGEIIPSKTFYDYEAKYLDDTSQLIIPAQLDPEMVAQIQTMAIDAFQAVDGSGLARVDFLLDNKSKMVYLNEINTMPGFTRISMYPKLWEATGISYPELVDRLLGLAIERYEDRQQNSTTRAV